MSFSVPALDLGIDDAGHIYHLLDDTGVVATSTPAVVQDPAVNAKVQTAAASKSVAGATTTTSPARPRHPATPSGPLPKGSSVDHEPDHGTGPSVTAPKSGINKAGFIDNSDGANIRTGPAEAGGQKVRDLPLPPASRVFVSGTHPDASHWWYVTAYLNETMVRGYVQDFRVMTELPEPTAKLHQVVSGDTAEVLAVTEATKHATEWLTMAWTAKGKDDVIAAASKEFLKMLVALAMAALSARGAKANYGNALKIASSMPTGGLPALAFAHGGQSGGPAPSKPVVRSGSVLGRSGLRATQCSAWATKIRWTSSTT